MKVSDAQKESMPKQPSQSKKLTPELPHQIHCPQLVKTDPIDSTADFPTKIQQFRPQLFHQQICATLPSPAMQQSPKGYAATSNTNANWDDSTVHSGKGGLEHKSFDETRIVQ
jgi:hypothetical protein